jgi:mevalonate kinase
LQAKTNDFLNHFSDLSKLQYVYFEKMIPQNLKEIWLTGLESKEYYMKLCGAGGGGFYLLYSATGKVPLHNNLLPFN